MAGHSKWANIKHKKAREDAKKGKIWSKCSRAIMAAARNGGGDPETNLALRYAVDEAKAANMPKDNIDYAIRRGTGEAGGQSYEQVIYEGYGSGGVAVMVDTLTDNRNRTAAEIRKLFEKHAGKLGGTGCVAYLFQSKGQIFVAKDDAGGDEEAVIAAALEAGGEDVLDEGEAWQVLTEPADYLNVRNALESAGMTIHAGQVTMIPDNTVACAGEDAERVLQLIDALEEHDDVQQVYANYEIPDEQMAAH